MANNLEKDIKELADILYKYYEEYKESEEECDPSEVSNKYIFRGKKEAYSFDSKKIRDLLRWHGLID